MNIDKILNICIIFLIGFLCANLLSYTYVYGLENPFSNNFGYLGTNAGNAPGDFIKEQDIEIYSDKIIIHLPNASLGSYAPTGSMEPLLDEKSNGIRIIPESEKDIELGDIITFEKEGYLIIHRVVERGRDDDGTYFITKGDNNSLNDGKIRFEEIRYKTIGILY